MSGEIAPRSQIDQALAQIETVADAKRVHDELATLEEYARRVGADTDQQNEIARGKFLAIYTGGVMLRAIPREERAGAGRRPKELDLEPRPNYETGLQRAYKEAGLAISTGQLWQAFAAQWKDGDDLDADIRRLIGTRDPRNEDVLTWALLVNLTGGTKLSEHVEWYTPAMYIEAARQVLGAIDLDPASSEQANQTVQAATYYSEADDGLEQEWHGRVWLNPPYGKGSGQFTSKLVEEYEAGNTTAAVLLLNAYGFDSSWFQPLWEHPICFTDHRVTFSSPTHKSGGPANGNIFIYLGPDDRAFAEVFRPFGPIVRTWPR